MNLAALGQNMKIKLKSIGNNYKSRLIHSTRKHKKQCLNMKVAFLMKFSSTVMQDKRKLCESHTRFHSFHFDFRVGFGLNFNVLGSACGSTKSILPSSE